MIFRPAQVSIYLKPEIRCWHKPYVGQRTAFSRKAHLQLDWKGGQFDPEQTFGGLGTASLLFPSVGALGPEQETLARIQHAWPDYELGKAETERTVTAGATLGAVSSTPRPCSRCLRADPPLRSARLQLAVAVARRSP